MYGLRKRKGERRELYMREKCAINPASDQLVSALYIPRLQLRISDPS